MREKKSCGEEEVVGSLVVGRLAKTASVISKLRTTTTSDSRPMTFLSVPPSIMRDDFANLHGAEAHDPQREGDYGWFE
jgi:hypothetical protein